MAVKHYIVKVKHPKRSTNMVYTKARKDMTAIHHKEINIL